MEKVLDIPLHHQKLPYWCWVAVSASIIHYYNKDDIQQCDLATRELTSDTESGVSQSCCPPRGDSPCDQPWYVGDVLKHYYFFHQLIDKPASFNVIKAEIDAGHPMVVRLEWEEGMNPNPAHFILLCGYAQKGGDDYIIIEDPAHSHSENDEVSGHHEYMYDDLFTHYIGTAETKWTHTYFTQPHKPSSDKENNEDEQNFDTSDTSDLDLTFLDDNSSTQNQQDTAKSKQKVHLLATKIAEIASEASDYYYETQEIAQDILTRVTVDDSGTALTNARNAGSLTYRAARELKKASRSLHRVHLLYAKVVNSKNQEEVNLYLQQLSKERTKIELAIKEMMNYKHEMDFMKED